MNPLRSFCFVAFQTAFICLSGSYTAQDTLLTKKERKTLRKQENKTALKGRRIVGNAVITNASLNSSFAVVTPGGSVGARIDFEDFLGFPHHYPIAIFDFQYNLTRHSSIYAEYYPIFRSATYDVQEEFDFGDLTIPVDAGKIRAFLNTQIWSAGYMYSFINDPNASLSFFFNLFILGVGTGVDVDSQNIRKRLEFTAPLPSFGYRFMYEILPKVRFGGSHSFFFLELGTFAGSISNFRLSADYRIFSWGSIGISYSTFDLDITSKAESFNGIIEYAYKGPGIYMQFIF
jgi:hypothetical protein